MTRPSKGATVRGAVPGFLHGLKVHVNTHICDGGGFLRWRKSHRRSRIDKKWHKRYGAVLKPCSGVCYQVSGMGLVVCPCFYKEMRKAVAAEPQPSPFIPAIKIPSFSPLWTC